MLDVAIAYERFKFLGDEFLTWLWFIIENDLPYLRRLSPSLSSLVIGNRIVLSRVRIEAIKSLPDLPRTFYLPEIHRAFIFGPLFFPSP